jgi:hypothetical protein
MSRYSPYIFMAIVNLRKNMSGTQIGLNLSSVTHSAPDGIEMGVMSDGTPYLSARGLAALCGTAPSVIITLIKEWDSLKHHSRGRAISHLVEIQGGSSIGLYTPIKKNGIDYHAINDVNCMAILEYYAFESQTPSEQAKQNFRNLARLSLRTFIYEKTGYTPSSDLAKHWQIFHERMTLNEIPAGYFSVFTEISNILVTSIRKGMPFDDHSMPDISVGQAWGTLWRDNDLDEQFGNRVKHPHKFPEHFPQKNTEAWIYPMEALGKFRMWLDDTYLRTKFPKYLAGKVKKGQLLSSEIKGMIEAVQPARLN